MGFGRRWLYRARRWLAGNGSGRVVQTDVNADIHAGSASHRSFVMMIMDEIEGVVDREGEEPTFPTTGLEDSTFGINYRSEPLRNRLRAIMEHRGTVTPENPDGEATSITLPNGTVYQPEDHFCDGYVPELDKVVDDPGAKCLSEESFLQSWVFGDPGKLMSRVGDTMVVDSDVMSPKAYRGDDVRYHIVHPGAKETHPWHQHTQRWFADPANPASPRKDVQSLGPGEAFELRLEGGAGGTQGTVGDSIFHCHLYPHFAQGFWGQLRIFDRLRDGSQHYPDGTVIQPLRELPSRAGATEAPDEAHPGFPLFVEGDVGQRAYKPPHGVVQDDFAELRRPGDTVREPTELEAANMPALDADKPGSGFIDPCPGKAPVRTYRPHAIDLPLTYNSAGWHDPQGRLYVERSHLPDVTEGKKDPEPYTIRARLGECVQVFSTNDLHLDENPAVPLDHVGRKDGVYQLPEATSEVSTHVHLVKFDQLGGDGTSVGWNYAQAAMPGQTYGYRWFVDEPLRTVFFHDHQYANLHQQRGLYGAMNVEPVDATWSDPRTGKPSDGIGPVADIHVPSGPDFREFTVFYSDRTPMWRADGRAVDPPGQPGDYAEDQGGYLINYRNEPFQIRTKPGTKGHRGDPAYVYSSAVHGDPSTPVFRAYPGDPVVFRNVVAAHEEVHSFKLHGHRWLNEPDNPMSTMTNIQGLSLAEYFDYEVRSGQPRKAPTTPKKRAERAAVDMDNGGSSILVNGAGAPGDYLYGSGALDDQWLGMWGIFRSEQKRAHDLVPLPDRASPTTKGQQWPALKPGDKPRTGPPANTCPAKAPKRDYRVNAIATQIVYNAATGVHDPHGLRYVRAEDEKSIRSGKGPDGPLVLRANAGDCLRITLANRLPADGLPPHPDVPLPAAADFPSGNRVSMHAGMVDTRVVAGDGATVGYNFDQSVEPGKSITMYWYVPNDIGSATIPLVDFGDRVGHRHHGLFGVLAVEPRGSTWTDPSSGGPAKDTSAVIHWTENGQRLGASPRRRD
jgi:manganese oxidase